MVKPKADWYIRCKCSGKNLHGYIEVDLKCPDKLNELHNYYPLVQEKLKIIREILSKYCRNTANHYDIKFGGVNKLVPKLRDKDKYVLQYRNLQLYLSIEKKLVGVNGTLKFEESDWLKNT